MPNSEPPELLVALPLFILVVVVSTLVGKGVSAAWSRWWARRER